MRDEPDSNRIKEERREGRSGHAGYFSFPAAERQNRRAIGSGNHPLGPVESDDYATRALPKLTRRSEIASQPER
jgi:hypothetical protein